MEKIKKMTRFLFVGIVLITATSCEDDDKNLLNDFTQNGGFVRFQTENPPSEVGVNAISELEYSFTLDDANKNIETYDLRLYADLSGSRTDTVTVEQVTGFPASFSFTPATLASLLGTTEDNINFGDSFFFSGEATTVDGLVYSASERLDFDDNDDEDPRTFTLSGNGVTNDLIDEEGYRQAFEFGFIILCPPPAAVSDLLGTWQIVFDSFETFIGDGEFEIVAGPGPNQVTALDIFDHPNPDTGGVYDVIFDLDPGTGVMTVERQPAWHCSNFGCGFGEGRIDGSGFLFNCVDNGLLKFNFEHTVDAGSYGTFAMDIIRTIPSGV